MVGESRLGEASATALTDGPPPRTNGLGFGSALNRLVQKERSRLFQRQGEDEAKERSRTIQY
jgi:hypothetical protein